MKGPPPCVRQADTIKCRKATGQIGRRKINAFTTTLVTSNDDLSNDGGVDVPGSQHDNDSKQ